MQGPKVSKFVKLPMLLDEKEMEELLSLAPFHFFPPGLVAGTVSREEFLAAYGDYVACLRQGKEPNLSEYRAPLSPMLSVDPTAVETVQADERVLFKPLLPIIQMQLFTFRYESGTLSPLVYGPDVIPWGVQLSYPTLYLNEKHEIQKIDRTFANTEPFHAIQRWVRKQTLPTPILDEGKRVNLPIRLGRNCFSWINASSVYTDLHVSTAR